MAEKKDKEELPDLNLADPPAEPIDVVIEDAGETQQPEVKVDAPAPKEGDDVDEAVATLRQQLADAEAARIAEANRANEEAQRRTKAEGELKTFRSTAHESQYNLVVGQIESLNDKATTLERDLAEAHAQGDYAKVAKTQREMSRVEAQIQRLEDGKADLEARKTEAPSDEAQPVRPTAGDPIQKFIDDLNVSASDKVWLRKHPDAVSSQDKFAKLSAAANYAANVRGLKPDSAEFYAAIEQDMGYAQAAPAPEPAAPTPAPKPRSQPSFAAPPSRDSMPINGQQKKTGKIRLSPQQQEAAKAADMTPGEYAKHLVKLVEDGQLDARNVQYVN